VKYISLFCFVLTGCATPDTRLPDIGADKRFAEQSKQVAAAFDEMHRLRTRLRRVAAPILRENAGLCRKTRPVAGILTKTVNDFSEALQDEAREGRGIDDEPTVVHVLGDSPANRAGIKVRDRLQTPEGDYLSSHGKDFEQRLAAGEEIVILRHGKRIDNVVISPEIHCDYRLKLKMTPKINAYATGKSIIVTSGMMNFTQSDEELAYIIGHELAHNTHGHIRKIVSNFVLSLFQTKYIRLFEAEADYVGLYYVARAGYTLDGIEEIWTRLARLSTKPIYKAGTHPTYPDRFVLIAATREEIKTKQATGQPLLPNPGNDNKSR